MSIANTLANIATDCNAFAVIGAAKAIPSRTSARSAQRRLITNDGLLAVRLICEGYSIRRASRITGLHHRTIMQMLIAAGERCEAMLALIRNVPATDVQCDEIWGLQKKQKSRHGGESDFA